MGDLLSQPRGAGGLGFGTVVTSLLFLIAIAATVTYLTVTKRDGVPVAAASGATVKSARTRMASRSSQIAITQRRISGQLSASAKGYYPHSSAQTPGNIV